MEKVIIDIGSNKLGGYLKLVDILGITDDWKKVFVEPNPENYAHILNEIKRIPNSVFYPNAVNSTGASVELVTRSDREGDIAATIFGKEYLDDILTKYGQKADGYTYYEVAGITIAEILESEKDKEVYLKIDCEGAEYEILMNFPTEYMKNIKRMFVEFHSNINNKFITDTFLSHGITIEEWE